HDLAHALVRLRNEQLAERADAEQALLGVERVGVINRLEAAERLALQIANRFVDTHVWSNARETRAHQAAGRVLRVSQQRGYLVPRRRVEQVEPTVTLLDGDALQEVRSVVGREHAQPELALRHR